MPVKPLAPATGLSCKSRCQPPPSRQGLSCRAPVLRPADLRPRYPASKRKVGHSFVTLDYRHTSLGRVCTLYMQTGRLAITSFPILPDKGRRLQALTPKESKSFLASITHSSSASYMNPGHKARSLHPPHTPRGGNLGRKYRTILTSCIADGSGLAHGRFRKKRSSQ